ncbi:hypothetical protein TIFTF001_029960 [Ficus carica]|uniref:Uncharacterized protein n=1 Tax=Ficus carica TaxID=3494 RepID=A0AA88DT98_FICCA|nr:hypothetical protein TIFTF001_029960 [Ficus carica]
MKDVMIGAVNDDKQLVVEDNDLVFVPLSCVCSGGFRVRLVGGRDGRREGHERDALSLYLVEGKRGGMSYPPRPT